VAILFAALFAVTNGAIFGDIISCVLGLLLVVLWWYMLMMESEA
jgi:hypothetical protein